MVLYQLPKLSYDYDELEPFFDTETVKIHHLKHHQAYVDGLNSALAEIGAASHPKYISAILSELNSIPESARSSINFFGGGFENHRLFWDTMTPDGDKIPGGKLEDQIDVYFDDFKNFKKIFSEKAISIQGSGWCWLVFNISGKYLEYIAFKTNKTIKEITKERLTLKTLILEEIQYVILPIANGNEAAGIAPYL